jgi:hypothetical protein
VQQSNKNLRLKSGVTTLEIQIRRTPSRLLNSSAILFCPRRPAMKFSPAVLSIAIVATCGATSVLAQNRASLEARIAARQDLRMAQLDLQNYWQIEYPRQRRELNLAIELTEAEIKGNKEAQESLRPFTRFTIGEPFPLTIANLRICRESAELRLNNLLAERGALIRFHGDQFRTLELRVEAARRCLVELEANEEIASAPATQ